MMKQINYVMGKQAMCTLVLLLAIGVNGTAQQKTWGERMAETILKTYPDSIVVKKAGELVANRPTRWDYEQGVVLKASISFGNKRIVSSI